MRRIKRISTDKGHLAAYLNSMVTYCLGLLPHAVGIYQYGFNPMLDMNLSLWNTRTPFTTQCAQHCREKVQTRQWGVDPNTPSSIASRG